MCKTSTFLCYFFFSQYNPGWVEKRVLKEAVDQLEKMGESKELKSKCSTIKEVRTVEDTGYNQSTVHHYILSFLRLKNDK